MKKANEEASDYMNYEEIKISALLQLSTETPVINSGGRTNRGEPGKPGTFVPEAVYVGAVGARFETPGVMEHEDMVRDGKLDVVKYKERMKISFETYLIEANARGAAAGKRVFCHVVGLGLGVWQFDQSQTKLYLEAFKETLQYLYSKGQLSNIGVVDMSWIKQDLNFDDLNIGPIVVKFSKRNPFDNDLEASIYKILISLKHDISA